MRDTFKCADSDMTIMKLSIVMPVYNERETIKTIINSVKKVKIEGIEKEIIIVDDYSTDGTREVLKTIQGCRMIYNERNRGKGFTVREGFRQANGDILVIQDADLEYDPNDLKKMVDIIKQGKSKVVYGSRFIDKDPEERKRKKFLPGHYIGNKVLTLCTSILFGHKITDMETCYKMFTREVFEKMKLTADRFEIEPEITAQILKNKYGIFEVPISYAARTAEKGKKINWTDGIKAFFCLVKLRFFR